MELDDAMIAYALFYLFALAAAASGVLILFCTNIVRMAYLLIGMLLALAGIYFLLGDYFLGVIQIIVYAGGVAVLMVFGVMLTSRQQAPLLFPRRWETIWLTVVSAFFLTGLTLAILDARWFVELHPAKNTVTDFGRHILQKFLGPFELASIVLLIGLLGAAYLARPRVPTPKARGQSTKQSDTAIKRMEK
jgi:NADH:ubiquinone oxidoreductase subunit 6 (subunit J)